MKKQALKKPIPMATIKKLHKTGKKISGIISMSLNEIIGTPHEEVLDKMSERLTGTMLLEGFSYKIVGLDGKNNILLKVVGNADAIVEVEEEDEV